MTTNFNGEAIGVAGDSIFEMMNRRYILNAVDLAAMKKHLPYLLWGLAFGFIISRAGAVRFDYIRDMFLFRSPQLFMVIGGAIGVALPLFLCPGDEVFCAVFKVAL